VNGKPVPVQRKLIPAGEHRAETQVQNSRFIASIAPAFDVAAARQFIRRIKREFSDATHNVPAFIIGHGQSVIEHCHDDGEPSGTAGRPVLAVLRGSGLGDVVAVVTRYFGGTKLGKGGLVRAYGQAAKTALEGLPLAEKVATQTLRVAVPYSLFERTRRLIHAHQGQVLDENFAGHVTLTVRFTEAQAAAFQKAIVQLSRGSVTGEVIATNPETVFPLPG